MNGEESFLEIALHASLVVKLVLLLLIAASLASWAMIFRKRKLLRDAKAKSEEFEKRFWSGGEWRYGYGGPGFYRGQWNGGTFGPCWTNTPIGRIWNCGM